MTLVYIEKLGFPIQKIAVSAQKIDSKTLVTYRIVVVNFFIQDKYNNDQFFKESFLVANTNMKVLLGIPFLFPSYINVRFPKKELGYRKYITIKTLFNKKRVKFVNHKECAVIAVDPKKSFCSICSFAKGI